MAARKDAPVYEDLFAELVATVKVPDPMVVSKALDIVLECPTKEQVEDLNKAADEESAQKVIFGDKYDVARQLFAGKPVQIWNAFMERYNAAMFGDADAGK